MTQDLCGPHWFSSGDIAVVPIAVASGFIAGTATVVLAAASSSHLVV